jgi:hypothetical protein
MIINLGFELRQKGSHHILTKDGIEEIIKEIIIKYKLNSAIDG